PSHFLALDEICITSNSLSANLTLGNQVWNDFDGDGKHDANEPGIPGASVSLYTDKDGDNKPDGAAIKTTTTDAKGNYVFTNLPEGRYIVSMPILAGYSKSPNTSTQATSSFPDNDVDDDNNLVILAGPNGAGGILYTNAITLNTGKEPITDGDDANGNLTLDLAQCGNLFVGDFVWNDLNANGVQDAGEPGINGATVTITFDDGRTATTTTKNYAGSNNSNAPQLDGYYNFPNLGPGNYKITFSTPAGFTPSPANQGADKTKDSNPVNGGAVPVTLTTTASDFSIDAGFFSKNVTQGGKIGDFVWKDVNKNGIQDAGEPGLQGVTVKLTSSTATSVVTTTDAAGFYQFTNVAAGTYTVTFVTPSGYAASPANAGSDNTKDSDADGGTVAVTLAANEINNTVDAGFTIVVTQSGDCAETTSTNGYYGGFEAGAANFGSNAGSDLYNRLPRDGSYEVVKSAGDLGGGGYLNIQPKSGSYFLAAHTSNNENDRVWYTKVNVIPGQIFNFCASVTLLKNLGNGAQYLLGIYANGTQIGIGRVTFDWTQICGTYIVPEGVTTLELSIRDPKKGLFFVAIDDICITHNNSLTVGNYVWNDWNGNGIKDALEYGIPNIDVKLYRVNIGATVNSDINTIPTFGSLVATTKTDSKGFYQFSNLPEGRYYTSITILPGYSKSPNLSNGVFRTSTLDPDSDIDDDNNAVRPANAKMGDEIYSNAISLKAGTEPTYDGDGADGNLTLDLALCGNLWIGNFVWMDANSNGIQDAGEKGINGVFVTITLPDGSEITKQTYNNLAYNDLEHPSVDLDGYYDFPRLGPGKYKLTFKLPETPEFYQYYIPTIIHAGADTIDSDIDASGSVEVILSGNVSNHNIDAGFMRKPASRSINDTQQSSAPITANPDCKLKVALEPKNPACYNNRTGSVLATVTGNTGKLSYKWSNSSTGTSLLNIGEGKYSLVVKDKITGCEVTSNEVIITYPAKMEATVKSAETNGYNIACKDSKTGIIDLEVRGGKGAYTYQWSNGATTQDLGDVAAGTYTVVVKDAGGCPVKAEISLKEPATKLEVTSNVSQPNCDTRTGSIDLVIAGGVAPYTVNWSNGATSTGVKKLAPAVYTATVKDAAGCEVSSRFEIKEYTLTVSAKASNETLNLANGEEATTLHAIASGGTGELTYAWEAAEWLSENDKANAIVSPKSSSDYRVTVKDAAGCTASARVSVKVVHGAAKPSLGLEMTGERVRVTPNPSNGNFNVILNGFSGKVDIKILDASGKDVANKPIQIDSKQMVVPFSLTNLPTGLYVVQIIGSEGSFKEKMIIRHN
ncbi:MAG: SpaA isopeptide-forming pilin-related protein, partial [Bacteroidota bacterium]|nr:SpaA isopeptide-forming pilin-related protein [Bacteroidota bacterium]